MKASLSIGAVSKQTGCNIETIRYYERIGLLSAPGRSGGGYRVYATADVKRLSFIRRARDLGFDLDQIRALLALSGDTEDRCADVRQLANEHLHEVQAKIADLRRMEMALRQLIQKCGSGEFEECPVIGSLSSGPVKQ
jgi:MerR family mercuric resistance operon transcriptional regulator